MKQETIEEAAPMRELIVFLDRIKKNLTNKTEVLTIQLIIDTIKNQFIEKEIKWQAEIMYSEEEVIKILNEREDYLETDTSFLDYLSNEKWFKKFKKKKTY